MNFEEPDEAHIPAQPPRPRAPSRLPGPDGDGRGAQDPALAPRTGAQEALGLKPAGPGTPRSDQHKLTVMTRRADFVAANSGLRVARPGFVLLTRANDGQGRRYGITVTKRIGNAVVRNRMKRRLRVLARELLADHGLADTDHVLVGRERGIERAFATLRSELLAALDRSRAGKGDPPRRPRARR